MCSSFCTLNFHHTCVPLHRSYGLYRHCNTGSLEERDLFLSSSVVDKSPLLLLKLHFDIPCSSWLILVDLLLALCLHRYTWPCTLCSTDFPRALGGHQGDIQEGDRTSFGIPQLRFCMCNSCSDHLQPMSLCLCRSIHLLDKSSHNDSLPIDSVLFLHNLILQSFLPGVLANP